jgi:hypothetical protein
MKNESTKALMTMTDIDPLIQRHTTTARVAGPTSPSRRKRRRHPAKGARIVAAGLGASTMFGLVAAMGIASAAANSSQAATSPVNTPVNPAQAATVPNTVAPNTVAPNTEAPNTVAPNAVAPNTGQTPAPSGPIVLQARPQVSVVNPTPAPAAAPAPAPAAVTSGSA